MSQKLEPFDEGMDDILLKNGFAYFPDWKFGPQDCWSGQNWYSINLMRHDFGYWVILEQNVSGNRTSLNMGSSNSAQEIIAVRDALKRLW